MEDELLVGGILTQSVLTSLQNAGKIVRSPYGVMHGKSSLVYYDEKGEDGLFTGLSKYVLLLLT